MTDEHNDTIDEYIKALRALNDALTAVSKGVDRFNSAWRKSEQRARYEFFFAPKRSNN